MAALRHLTSISRYRLVSSLIERLDARRQLCLIGTSDAQYLGVYLLGASNYRRCDRLPARPDFACAADHRVRTSQAALFNLRKKRLATQRFETGESGTSTQ